MPAMTESSPNPVSEAVAALKEVAAVSADQLDALQDDLTTIQSHRRRGSSWRHIIATDDIPKPLVRISAIVARLALAGGALRRTLALALREEGMPIKEIASRFEVSRQRISALVRPGRSD